MAITRPLNTHLPPFLKLLPLRLHFWKSGHEQGVWAELTARRLESVSTSSWHLNLWLKGGKFKPPQCVFSRWCERTLDEAFNRISCWAFPQTRNTCTPSWENAVNCTLVPTSITDTTLDIRLGARGRASKCSGHHQQCQQTNARRWVHGFD